MTVLEPTQDHRLLTTPFMKLAKEMHVIYKRLDTLHHQSKELGHKGGQR